MIPLVTLPLIFGIGVYFHNYITERFNPEKNRWAVFALSFVMLGISLGVLVYICIRLSAVVGGRTRLRLPMIRSNRSNVSFPYVFSINLGNTAILRWGLEFASLFVVTWSDQFLEKYFSIENCIQPWPDEGSNLQPRQKMRVLSPETSVTLSLSSPIKQIQFAADKFFPSVMKSCWRDDPIKDSRCVAKW